MAPLAPLRCSRTAAACALVALCAALALAPAAARSTADALPPVSLADLPQEARDVNAAIRNGGPFAYPRDGVVFGNRERILPVEPRGYYHEYTVPTPGMKSRGARRIVCGGPVRAPRACWYTADHYQSFQRIQE
jgi:ribonuclease T1